jgi:hypothetical protein
MKLGALILNPYKLIIVISSWFIAPFISMKWPYLSLLSNLSLKSILCDLNIATPACFGLGTISLVNCLLAFHTRPVFVSVNKVGLL